MLIDHYFDHEKRLILLVLCTDDSVILKALCHPEKLREYDNCPFDFVLASMGKGYRMEFNPDTAEQIMNTYEQQGWHLWIET